MTTTDKRTGWRAGLVPGDRVLVYGTGGRRSIGTVDKISLSGQITLTSGKRFGYTGRSGGTWPESFLTEWNADTAEDIRAERDRRALVGKVQKVDWPRLSTETLRAVVEALNTAQENQEPSQPVIVKVDRDDGTTDTYEVAQEAGR
jgi:hypothetical protein